MRIGTALVFCFCLASSAMASYYVGPSGDDSADGTSPGTAWKSISRVNSADLDPGDTVFFQGGATFVGNLVLDASDAGSAGAPVVITSFGTGRATIDGRDGTGIAVSDAGGIEIREINVVGSGPATNTAYGVDFFTDRSDGTKFEHIRIDQTNVSGFRRAGIAIRSDDSSLPGYRDVQITRCKSFDNGDAGIKVGGYYASSTPALSHENVLIADCEVYNNFGDPAKFNSHTGSGIIVSAVDGALVEFCHVHHNGGINSENSGGPVGIWTWQSNNVVIRSNISHHNKTGGSQDGGGFDIDGGARNTLIEYNLSYENEGPGFLLAQFSGAPAFRNHVIRYNISYNDGRRNGNGGFLIWSGFGTSISDVDIYGNTVYLTVPATGSPRPVRVYRGSYSNIKIRNNIFMTEPGLQLMRANQNLSSGQIHFQGNAYWTTDGTFEVEMGGNYYYSLAAWDGTGQEMMGGIPLGLHEDPLLVDPGNPVLPTDPSQLSTLTAYKAQPNSPVIDAGLDLQGLFGVDPGPWDFYGVALPQSVALDIGAAEDCGVECGPSACESDPECDDGNGCTDDQCIEGSCQYENNSISCDDGLVCNGFDTCSGGSCSLHVGDPCPPDLFCDETTGQCEDVECLLDSDCDDGSACTTDGCDGGVCVNDCLTAPYAEDFEAGFGDWDNVGGDVFDWTRRSGSTPSSSTGPSGDHTTGSGSYAYIEGSSPRQTGDTAILEGPCFDLGGAAEASLSFWYHMYGSAVGLLEVEVSSDCDTWQNVWSLLGNQGNGWSEASIDLSGYVGSHISVRFIGTRGTGWRSDIAIDDIFLDVIEGPSCAADAACDDGDFCNGAETCDIASGSCVAGTAVDCSDGVSCTVDSCNEATDSCDILSSDGLCDNGLFCDGTETCDPVNDCQAGTAVDASDGVPCTVDGCDETNDVVVHVPDHGFCDNFQFCDGSETCDPVGGCGAGSDPDPCPGQSCNEATDICEGCFVDAICDDGVFCNGAESCNAGICQAGSPPTCDDGVGCTDDSCNTGTDSCDNLANSANCGDALFCNGVEFCDPVNDCQAGADPCGGGATCDEVDDACVGGREPLVWMSFRSSTTVPGVGVVTDEDIVSYDETTGLWALEFDGSDVGLGGGEIDGLGRLPSGDLLLSLTVAATVGGFSVDDSDVVRFTPSALGATTTGTFSIYFDGSDVGLTGWNEDVDAIALAADGRLIISTTGTTNANGISSGQDEDLWIFTGTLGAATSGSFAQYFDGSDVGLGSSSSEDIDAATLTSDGSLRFSTVGSFSVSGAGGADEDVAEFAGSFGTTTAGSFSLELDLSTLGISTSEDIGSLLLLEP